MSDKDIEDLKFASSSASDMVAMSFVRAPEEVKLAHAVMDEVGRRVPVIAKLEKPEAVSDLAAIVEAFDGLMVAAVTSVWRCRSSRFRWCRSGPSALCRQAAKPVIVATQMLDSMISDRRPTRAEVSDVANAVFDGADAVMLSAETSVGAHPGAHGGDDGAHRRGRRERRWASGDAGVVRSRTTEDAVFGDAIAAAACEVGRRIGAAALCCFTRTGDTALRLARQRSPLAAGGLRARRLGAGAVGVLLGHRVRCAGSGGDG